VTGSYALAFVQLGVITLVAAGLLLTFPVVSPPRREPGRSRTANVVRGTVEKNAATPPAPTTRHPS